jgi:hypothetical protein
VKLYDSRRLTVVDDRTRKLVVTELAMKRCFGRNAVRIYIIICRYLWPGWRDRRINIVIRDRARSGPMNRPEPNRVINNS